MIAPIAPDSRFWVVGAVNGEAEALRRIHQQIAARYRIGDKLIYTGNLMGPGGNVRAAINEALLFRRALISSDGASADDVIFLRGTQEEMWQKLLQLQFASRPGDILAFMRANGLDATLDAYNIDPKEGESATARGTVALSRWTASLRRAQAACDGHSAYIKNLHHAAMTEDKRFLCCHAGLNPYVALDKQKDSFWWGHPDFAEHDAPIDGVTTIIRGFDFKNTGVKEAAHLISLDGGSGREGNLVAALFDDDKRPTIIEG